MKEVIIKYELGHSCTLQYQQTGIFCPNCGKKEVWEERGEGDYYEGPTHVCVNCDHSFTLPRMGEASGYEIQVIKQIRGEVPHG